MSVRRSWFGFAMLLLWAAPSPADSDGYYCVGPSYLAYDVRSNDKHVLSIVRGKPDGTIATVDVELPDFQTHGMQCHDRTIDIAGWETIYTVSAENEPPVIRTTPLPRPGDLPKWPQHNLAEWNHGVRNAGTEVVDLPWPVPHELRVVVKPTETLCVYVVTTTLSKRGSDEPAATLVHRTFEADCGD